MKDMARILITGYKPFLQNDSNPTELLALSMGGTPLEVSYQAVDEFLDVIDPEDYDLILCMGLHARSFAPRIELAAYNQKGQDYPDVRGYMPEDEPIDPKGEDKRLTTLDTEGLKKHLEEKGYTFDLSTDPGRYLCNYIYYKALGKMAGKALFIHFPPVMECWPLEREKAFLKDVLKYLR